MRAATPARDGEEAAADPQAVDVDAAVTTLDADALAAAVADLAAVAERAPGDVTADDVAAVLEGLAAVERERHPWRDPDRLAELYYSEGLKQSEVADRLGCGQRCVARWMDHFGIAPGRGRGAAFDGALNPTENP